MNIPSGANSNGIPPPKNPEDDDFFGDQFSATVEEELQTREIEALRHRHMTAGIREGKGAAHDAHLQEGFDEGFADGANASAEAGFMLGCCSMLEAFFSRSAGNLSESSLVYCVEDTEVPVQDIRDIEQETSRLRADLLDLRDGVVIELASAKAACRKVAVFDVPKALEERISITQKTGPSVPL